MRHRRLPRLNLARRTYYLTCCIHGRRALLANPALAERLIRLYAGQRDEGRIKLHGYVVMPDHYHVLLTLRGGSCVSEVVRAVHSVFAKECRRATGTQGRVWQKRFYDRVVRSESDLHEKLDYVHGNPVRAGLAESPGDYVRSSFAFWDSGRGVVSCDPLAWDET